MKLGLQHFVLKSEGRKLYRDVLRALKGVDASTAAGVREAARDQFADHEHETDIDREARAPVPTVGASRDLDFLCPLTQVYEPF
jgi:hypothetical protein